MMRNKIWVTTFREIRSSLGRFLAIFAIIALGVGFFAGLSNTKAVMINSMEDYFEKTNFYDLRLVSTIGFDEEAVQELKDADYDAKVESSIAFDLLYKNRKGNIYSAKVYSLPSDINQVVLVEGRLPEKSDEVVVDSQTFSTEDLETIINISDVNDEADLEHFAFDEYKIVGIVQSPLYIQYERGNTALGNGVLDAFMYMKEEGFVSDVYTDVYVKFPENYHIYSDEYKDYIDDKTAIWEDILKEVSESRRERIMDEAREELDEAKAEYQDGKEKIKDGWQKIDKAKGEINYSLKKMENLSRLAQVNPDQYGKLYRDSMAEIEDGNAKIEAEESELRAAEENLEEARIEIEKAEAEIEDIEHPKTFVLGRNTNVGYVCFESDSGIVGSIASVFPVFFFLVAALVCMTTMNRMVEEQRTQIGVLKALGYSEATIMCKYVVYSGLAATTGAVGGFFLGTNLFPKAIWFAYNMMYHTQDVFYVFDPELFVISLAVALICSVGTTFISCRIELIEMAASLMRPKAPKAGKRILLEYIPFLWNRLKFLQKVSLRNIFRYKKRLIMMIIGISGCTALLVTGFGLNNSITNVAENQYSRVSLYDIAVSLSEEEEGEVEAFKACGITRDEYMLFGEYSMTLIAPSGESKDLYVDVFDKDTNFEGFFDLHDLDGNSLELPEKNECILNFKMCNVYDINVGDVVKLRDSNLNQIELTVAGINENFIYNYIYINSETYEAMTGDSPEKKNAYISIADDVDPNELSAELMKRENVAATSVSANILKRVASMMESMFIVIVLVIASAGTLAFIVLYNLTNINITERVREIATIKVLGFYKKESASYVLRENVLLTIMGGVVGLFLGKLLHGFVMSKIVIDLIAFDVTIKPESYIYSFILTIIFTLLVNLFMSGKLEKINMTESLKSVD